MTQQTETQTDNLSILDQARVIDAANEQRIHRETCEILASGGELPYVYFCFCRNPDCNTFGLARLCGGCRDEAKRIVSADRIAGTSDVIPVCRSCRTPTTPSQMATATQCVDCFHNKTQRSQND